jgi:hypothetical protein
VESAEPAYDVFISYPRELRRFAQSLAERLKPNASVFFADHVQPGEVFAQQLLKALTESRMVAVLLSQHSEQARFQRDEISQAAALLAAGRWPKRIVPVVVDEGGMRVATSLPALRQYRWLEAREPATAARQLLEIVREVRGDQPTSEQPRVQQEPAARPRWLEAVGVVANRSVLAGCACLVTRRHVVTVAHVLPPKARTCTLRFPFSSADPERELEARVLVRSVEEDYAVLELEVSVGIEPLELAAPPEAGSPFEVALPELGAVESERGIPVRVQRGVLGNQSFLRGSDLAGLRAEGREGARLVLELGALEHVPVGASGSPVMVEGRVAGLFAYAETSSERPRVWAIPSQLLAAGQLTRLIEAERNAVEVPGSPPLGAPPPPPGDTRPPSPLRWSNGFPTIGNDAVGGADLLDVGRQARIFARGMVSKSLVPPLAIGLFGDWGAGKSYFMRLVREAAPEESKREDCFSDVCQIEFNAWHYMDANLWASLAGRIFDELSKALGQRDNDYEAARQKLRERLRSTVDAKDEAEAATRATVDRLKQLRQTITTLEEQRNQKREGLGALFDSQVWREELERLLPVSRPEAEEAAKRLGLPLDDADLKNALDAPEQLRALAADLESGHGRLRTIANTFSARNWPTWVIGGVFLVVPPVVAVLLALDSAKALLLGVAQAAALATTVATQIRSQLERASKFAEYAKGIQEKGEQIRQRAWMRLGTQEKAALEQYGEAQAALETALARKVELERTIATLSEQLAAISAGRLVYDFVLERSGNASTYRRHEGIVSVVRRDLETLSDLLRQWRKERPEKPSAEAPAPTPAERDRAPIQRIILYIDDLDRCPPEQVVEVLQAVHLLLAFDLFVVMVGVDARWLERSLQKNYRAMLGQASAKRSAFRRESASPQDYLEKIFQVPFTLPRVQKDGFEALVQANLRLLSEIEAERAPKPDLPKETAAAVPAAVVVASRTLPAVAGAVAGTEPAKLSAPAPTSSAKGHAQAAGAAVAAEGGDALNEHFYVESAERQFMTSQLFAFMGTPRLIKRFTNIYRLLRIGVKPEEYAAFAGHGAAATHRAAQVLLAVTVGFPRFGGDMLRVLAWPELAGGRFHDFPSFLEAIEHGSILPQDGSGKERASALELLQILASEVPATLEPWTRWAREVGRYSMYWQGR